MTGRGEREERERREEREIMPSLMATSLRWRTHSARTNYFYNTVVEIIIQAGPAFTEELYYLILYHKLAASNSI
jgi:hypothetical protein